MGSGGDDALTFRLRTSERILCATAYQVQRIPHFECCMSGSFPGRLQRAILASLLFAASACGDTRTAGLASPLSDVRTHESEQVVDGSEVDAGTHSSSEAPDSRADTPISSEKTCNDLENRGTRALSLAYEEADKTCAEDADCVNVGHQSDCGTSCSREMSRTGHVAFRNRVKVLNQDCAEYRAHGCLLTTLPCRPSAPPRCSMGQCIPGKG
jgi:hypothetical protein